MDEIKPRRKRILNFKNGCKCVRSGCVRKYCKCWYINTPCSSRCQCFGCRNYEEHPDYRKEIARLMPTPKKPIVLHEENIPNRQLQLMQQHELEHPLQDNEIMPCQCSTCTNSVFEPQVSLPLIQPCVQGADMGFKSQQIFGSSNRQLTAKHEQLLY